MRAHKDREQRAAAREKAAAVEPRDRAWLWGRMGGEARWGGGRGWEGLEGSKGAGGGAGSCVPPRGGNGGSLLAKKINVSHAPPP